MSYPVSLSYSWARQKKLVGAKDADVIHDNAVAFDTSIISQHANCLPDMHSKKLSFFCDDSEADAIQSVVLLLTKLKEIEKKIGGDE